MNISHIIYYVYNKYLKEYTKLFSGRCNAKNRTINLQSHITSSKTNILQNRATLV